MDTVDLVTALIEGVFETPLWGSFLESLRRVSAADYAFLILRPPGRPMDDGLQLVSGDSRSGLIADLYRCCFYPQDSARREWAEEGKPHSLDDLMRFDQGRDEAYCKKLVDEFGLAGSRHIRVSEPLGVDAWLVIARRSHDFSEQAAVLLAAMAPPLRAILRVHVSGESDRFRAKMAAEAVRRLQCGWFLLDEAGHVLAADTFGETILARSDVISRNSSGRLMVNPVYLEREILQVVAELARGITSRPRVISLRGDPWLDMLLIPERKRMISDSAVPAVIAYVHGDNWRSTDRCGQLSDLFDLTASEARLALALCRGKSITEAAVELGLALETARSYSKSIYAKTGTRGMADLVRIIMGSILTLAPDD